jgi:hypothetical protein
MLPLGKLNIRTELKDSPERFTNFTKDEQYFLMTLWSIFRSPLMIGGNMPNNDEFTTSLITNEEAIRVNQNTTDNKEICFKNGISIWTAKDKENGKTYKVRDLWLKSDVAKLADGYEVELAPHGAKLFSLE